jgi:spore germination cell wall hydrolase CwlJ-like protein
MPTKLTREQLLDNQQAHKILEKMEALPLLARLIRGEAGNQPPAGMLAVAHVVINRDKKGGWFGRGLTGINGIILKPWQFSCFNETYPRLAALANEEPPAVCTAIASLALDMRTVDPTFGATYYYAPKAMVPKGRIPKWVKDMDLTIVIADHRFYKPKVSVERHS